MEIFLCVSKLDSNMVIYDAVNLTEVTVTDQQIYSIPMLTLPDNVIDFLSPVEI